ncbi:MAG: histidine phosphatase family protein [Anaerolineaceae bacterium]|nr:histidine phosphatase family protein [Anaerolineaceae bacterium]
MKTLLLMRHAKSSWKEQDLKDRKRPLSKRGKRNAPQMGKLVHEKELIPQLILSSSAVRAKETTELFCQALGYQGEVRYLDELYMAEADEILAVLAPLPDDLERVMVIGHNPGLESLLPMLTKRVAALPTAAIAYLAVPVDSWKDIHKKTHAELIELWSPKEMEEE